MHAKNKQDRDRKLPIILTVIGLVLVAGVISGFIFQDTLKTFIADTKANVDNRGKPVFAFNDAKFPDWADTGNTWSDGTDGEAPITTMLITQCTPGSHCGELVDKCKSTRGKGSQCEKLERDTADGCMVHLYYMRHTVDPPDTAVADKLKRDTSFKGITVREIGVKTLSMNTPEGVRQYQLHQYDIDHNGNDTYKRGNAFGYISLSDGHIEVQSVCREASQLDEVLPALNAVSLVK